MPLLNARSMTRPLRIEYTGAHYVTSRGNERKAIFRDDSNREKFLELTGRAVEQFGIRVHAYVLMSNHYHLLIETPRGGLNRALRYLNGVYTQIFNRRHKRVGHLFQGRYKAILVEKDAYLLELSRYIHLNPWRVNRGTDPIKYRWSSLGPYLGTRVGPSWLSVREIMKQFGSQAKRRYRQFVAEGIREGIRTPWEGVRGQMVMGSEKFVDGGDEQTQGESGKKDRICWAKRAGGNQGGSNNGSGREILRHQAGRDEGERLAVYGAEICGELLDEAIRFHGVTRDRGAGGPAF